jgi:hypothetical protein
MPFEKRKSPDASLERGEQNVSPKKRFKFSPSERSQNFLEEGGVTSDATSSVGGVAVAGTLGRLDLSRSDQTSHTPSMDHQRGGMGRVSDQLSRQEKMSEISQQERERFQELQNSYDLPTEAILAMAGEFKQKANQALSECFQSSVREKSHLFDELAITCFRCRVLRRPSCPYRYHSPIRP